MQHCNVEFKEIKALTDDEKVYKFSGYGAVYGNIDMGGDILEPGAFDDSIKQLKPSLLFNHQENEPVGIFSSITTDEYGLAVVGEMPKDDDFVSKRVVPQMRIKSIRGLSVGYAKQEWYEDENGIRHITKALLLEISLVHRPMNTKTVITEMKSINKDKQKEIEKQLTRQRVELQQLVSDLKTTKFLME